MPIVTRGGAHLRTKNAIVQPMHEIVSKHEDPVSIHSWENKTQVILEWLASNPLKIGIPSDGTEETIREQIKRGNKFHEARKKCWEHIKTEISELPGVSLDIVESLTIHGELPQIPEPKQEKLSPKKKSLSLVIDTQQNEDENSDLEEQERMTNSEDDGHNVSPLRGKLRPGKPITPSNAGSASAQQEENELPTDHPDASEEAGDVCISEDTANHESPKKSLANMSMMERQAEWLRRKQKKAEVEKQRQVDEAEKELTFQPRINRSQWGSVRTKLLSNGEKDAKKDRLARRKSMNITTSSNVETGQDDQRSLSTELTPNSTNTTPRNMKGKLKKKGSKRAQSSSSLIDTIKSEIKASSEKRFTRVSSRTESDEQLSSVSSQVNTQDISSPSEGSTNELNEGVSREEQQERDSPEEPEVEVQTVSAVESSSKDSTVENSANFVPFSYEHTGLNDSKARLRLRDPAMFQLNSMYRKRDKYAGREGISLQMGRREDNHTEQVVAVLFDKERVTEDEAKEWWKLNQSRFPLVEKDEE